MKLICLNIWGGQLLEPLLSFLQREAVDTDIFCFQEVFDTDLDPPPILRRGARADIYRALTHALPGLTGHFALSEEGVDFDGPIDAPVKLGLATFVKKGLNVDSVGNEQIKGVQMVTGIRTYSIVRNLQYLRVHTQHGPIIVANFHGLLDDGNKWDTVERIEQFMSVRRILATLPKPHILCGDFNVRAGTKSLKLFEEAGMRDLAKEYAVPLTRNGNYAGLAQFNDPISDYAFVSPELTVTRFEALPDEVSDHLALVLEFH